ncbi:Mitochondrial inner membrane translocase subunit Tim17/Tim22/Tim23/peroxisomal protein PMP24 [Gossypium australe]|uniref:Mitochondrial inner membrane translocase subunit Tim17/Tim22/Tim23/peroxisomal protein PMP24 n=1 Tax=Gossypium australe TaxID=47621 RepID=A0A5B6UDY9_9ROSI|nr:Mitochondrial inner membrane translocase subunit Tim17/Tim22/Tim23/peroxisomal protein PMP24 [Gossypium australe]
MSCSAWVSSMACKECGARFGSWSSYMFSSWLHFVTGWIHLKLVEKANEGNMAAKSSGEIGEAKSGLGAAIDRLEENLNK